MAVKRISSDEEMKSGGSSDFIGLAEGEKFLGYCLSEVDTTVEETTFFPYKYHWTGKTSVPCTMDDNCVYCEDGDRPRAKGYSLWLVLEDEAGRKVGENGNGELRIFDMPYSVYKQFAELRGEGDKIKGRKFRVSRVDDKTYILLPKTDTLKSAEVKAWAKDKNAPDFEAMLEGKLKKASEGTAVRRALEEDDEPAAKSGNKGSKGAKGKGKSAPEPEEQAWPDAGLDEETVTVSEVDDDGNWIEVTSDSYEDAIKVWTTEGIEFELNELSEGDEVTISTGELDSDGEYVLSREPEVPEPEGEGGGDNELPDKIEDEEFTVLEVDEGDSTIDVESDELAFTLFFLDTMKVDFDDYKKGDKIKVTAEKDRAGDLVATEIPEKVSAKKGTTTKKKTTTKRKGK